MKNYLLLAGSLFVFGCASTEEKPVKLEYADLAVSYNEMESTKWQQLERFPARYPKKAVIQAKEGCATIEYVITPQNEIRDIQVVASTNPVFAAAAKDVITNWHWNVLAKNITDKAVKTQTRFDFCFDTPEQSCKKLKPNYSCPSSDIIYSTGTRVVKY
ncbi:MAG: energy transducer TonB [Pseudoalteromonas sp.]|uniref:energy transducer TonB n=1 Tax=Pseudoalteromonas sp. TaxID=53249 RepID=UPI001DE62F0F|nr:energy transducer TonB [Pseudoalteromonas sp.]NRA77004.1 energy transducer TonB [Pseudoalteromonas sp.]